MKAVRDFSPAERMYAVYASYGKAMMAAHSLERCLAVLMIIHVTDRIQLGPERTKAIERIDKLPLGPLIESFCGAYAHTDDLAEELSNMLFFRNELAHRISDTILGATAEREWEDRVIQELTECTAMFRETRSLLEPYSAQWCEKHGINLKQLMEKAFNLYPGILPRHEA